MYLEYFGFLEKPFSITPDVKYLFLTKQYESALDTMKYAICERMGFFILSGEVGTGKTTIARELLNRLDTSVETAYLINPLLSVPELLQAINRDFGNRSRYLSPQRQIESLNKFLFRLYEEGKNAVVIIDEAQNLSLEALEMIRLLSNLETDKAKLLQILLVGQPELMRKLEGHELRQLNQRITVRVNLVPLKFIEMVRYINHRIALAGGMNKVFFEADAYRRIFKESKGYPRLVNIICDRALMAAYVADKTIIDKKLIKNAVADITGGLVRKKWWSPQALFGKLGGSL